MIINKLNAKMPQPHLELEFDMGWPP